MSGGESEVLNPVDIELMIRKFSNEIAKGVAAVSRAHAEHKRTARVLDLAFARAYMASKGPSHEKKYLAEIATEQERMDADVAEVAFRHAERQMKALETQLSSAQTISKSVNQMFGASGTGRGQ